MEVMGSLRSAQAGCSSSYGAAKSSFRSGFSNSGIKPSLAFVTLRRVNGGSGSGLGRRGVVLVQAKGRKGTLPGMPGNARASPTPQMPNFDADDNPKFVIFIRTLNVPRWYPLSIVSGGTTAKIMLAAMNNEWGRKLYGGTLTRNMASVVYKDERAIRQSAFKTYPVLKAASGFRYGYKIVDKKNPRSALTSSDVIEIPPEGELTSIMDKVKEGFANIASGVKDTFGSISPITPEPEAQQPESESKPVSKPVSKQSSRKKGK
ncbi:unnamed protein product [Calypogeia fissa]